MLLCRVVPWSQCPRDQGVCIDATCTSLGHSSRAHSARVPASDDLPQTSSEYRTMNCNPCSSFQREAHNISTLFQYEFLIVSDLNCFLHFLSFEIRESWNPKLHTFFSFFLSLSLYIYIYIHIHISAAQCAYSQFVSKHLVKLAIIFCQ